MNSLFAAKTHPARRVALRGISPARLEFAAPRTFTLPRSGDGARRQIRLDLNLPLPGFAQLADVPANRAKTFVHHGSDCVLTHARPKAGQDAVLQLRLGKMVRHLRESLPRHKCRGRVDS